MKLLISLTILFFLVSSCSDDDIMQDTVIQESEIVGMWKPLRYEYKGKTYPVSGCQQKGQILINFDFSGVYENYDVPSSTGNCNLLNSFTGKWNYDMKDNTLKLTYKESGANKILSKNVETFSDTFLKISDNTKDLDNIPGVDDATLVFTKE